MSITTKIRAAKSAPNRTARQHIRQTLLGKRWSRKGVAELKSLLPHTVDSTFGIGIKRFFTKPGVDPYRLLEWEVMDAVQQNWRDGTESFRQNDVEKPVDMSYNALCIMAGKYFRVRLETRLRDFLQAALRSSDRSCSRVWL